MDVLAGGGARFARFARFAGLLPLLQIIEDDLHGFDVSVMAEDDTDDSQLGVERDVRLSDVPRCRQIPDNAQLERQRIDEAALRLDIHRRLAGYDDGQAEAELLQIEMDVIHDGRDSDLVAHVADGQLISDGHVTQVDDERLQRRRPFRNDDVGRFQLDIQQQPRRLTIAYH